MLKMHLAAGLAVTALMAGSALAQTTAPTQPAGPGQVMTQMPPDLMRGSQLMGIDVYGADNQKIGDIDEVLVDRQGKIHGLVVGVGGFLGIGQKDVAIPFEQVQWMSNQELQASNANQSGYGTNTAGDVTTPTAPSATGANQPATTGSSRDYGRRKPSWHHGWRRRDHSLQQRSQHARPSHGEDDQGGFAECT
jgi:sporulation protein YlmC with PRC-barrel domain